MASWRKPGIAAAVLAAVLLFLAALPPAGTAKAAVGVQSVSRSAGVPGDPVELTIGCGFCYPPCEGPPGHRNAPCMMGSDAPPPESFPVSLVPIGRVPRARPCTLGAHCPAIVDRPPRRAPFTLLGEAVPPADIEAIRESGHSYVPRYRLLFEVPERRPGVYAFVIFCDPCLPGRRGPLIANPGSRSWRIRINPPIASYSPVKDWLAAFVAPLLWH